MTISLQQLTLLIKGELEFAKENARLTHEVECFSEQRDYWEGKAEAFQHVVDALETTNNFVSSLEQTVVRIKGKFSGS